MLKSTLALAAVAFGAIVFAGNADALPQVEKGDLNRHCVAKYQPRGIQAMADPFSAPLANSLRCRLNGGAFGFTNENQSPGEVCQRLTGGGNWSNRNGRVWCNAAAANTAPSVFQPRIQSNGFRLQQAPNARNCRWVFAGGRFICR